MSNLLLVVFTGRHYAESGGRASFKCSRKMALYSILWAVTICMGLNVRMDGAINQEKPWLIYSVRVPGFTWWYSLPPEFTAGYGRIRKEAFLDKITLDMWGDPEAEPSEWGPDAKYKRIGMFYKGVKGDFVDWDVTMNIGLIRILSSKSFSGLSDYINQVTTEPLLAKKGQKIPWLNHVKQFDVNGKKFLYQEAADMMKRREMELANGWSTTNQPMMRYYIPISDTLIIDISLSFENKRQYKPDTYKKMNEFMLEMISRMRFEARGPEAGAVR